MCEHMKPRGYWKFSFADLFETQRCGDCGERFSVPLKRQYLVFFLWIAFSLLMAWVSTYCSDIPSRIGRFFSALAIAVLWEEGIRRLAYSTYIRAFQQAQATMAKSTETT